MKLLRSISVGSDNDARAIELYRGDLTTLSDDDAVDILVVSAFPDDFTATTGSLIGALNRAGLSVAELAANKAIDLRSERSCWLSVPVGPQHGFNRLLCFEPLKKGTPPELIDDVFDSLDQILLGEYKNAVVAMPLVATGDMGWPVEDMSRALLRAAVARFQIGLPLRTLKIVERDADKASQIEKIFAEFSAQRGERIASRPRRQKARKRAVSRAPGGTQMLGSGAGPGAAAADNDAAAPAEETGFDCFVSYSRVDSALVDTFVELIRSKQPDARVFRDSEAIRVGSDWVSVLADAIDSSRLFVAIFSPDYFDSKWCRREFSAAIYRDDQGDDDILYPIFLRKDPTAPSLYLVFNHVDCCEADIGKLEAATERLVEQMSQ